MIIQSVLVTGTDRGIGLEMIRQLANGQSALGNPRHVFACYKDTAKNEKLEEIADGAKGDTMMVHLLQMDVSDDKQIADAVKFVDKVVGESGLTMLINNAGMLEREGSHVPSVNRSVFMKHMDINAASPLIISQAFLPLLSRASKKHTGDSLSVYRSSVINIGSGRGSMALCKDDDVTMTGFGYRVSKTALNMVTKCLAVDLKQENILFVSMSPGWVQTDMGTAAATSTPLESVTELFTTLTRLNHEHNGAFLQVDGTVMPF